MIARCVWLAALLSLWTVPSKAAPSAGVPVPGTPLTRYDVQDRTGRSIRYYAARPKTAAPILLMIQGSGCGTILHTTQDGRGAYSTLYDLLPFAGEGNFTVVAVEKPFAGEMPGDGTSKACSAAFNVDFSAESWALALQTVLTDVRRRGGIDRRRTLIFGGSEGAVMAALLARDDPTITDVATIGGPGTTQLFDFVELAYEQCFNRAACLADVERQAAAINARPDSSTDFAWGHPFKRWSSFFKVDGGDALLRSTARVFMAFGTADRSVPPLSQEVTVAKLTAAGRDLTVHRIENGNHGLMRPADADMSGVERVYRAALAWFWRGAKPAALTTR